MTEGQYIEQCEPLLLKFTELSVQFIKEHPEYQGRMVDSEKGGYRANTSIVTPKLECSIQNGKLAIVWLEVGYSDSKRIVHEQYPEISSTFTTNIYDQGDLIRDVEKKA